MSELAYAKLTDSKFIIEVNKNIVKFSGCIDLLNPEPLFVPFFDNIHENIIKENIKEVILDFKELSFLNSSGIKTITKWIMKIHSLSPENKYKMKLLYSEEITWQRTSLMILTYLAPDNVQAVSEI